MRAHTCISLNISMQDIRTFIDLVENLQGNSTELLQEGPVWDKIKSTAAAGAVAGGIGYAALTGHPATQPPPSYDQDQISQIIQADQPTAKTAAQPAGKPLKASTATAVDTAMEKLLYTAAVRAGLQGKELAQFMAQAAHETHGFHKLAEHGSAEYFKKYDPDHSPRLAKILGNTKSGDGLRYKGRGFLMITGRDNYRRAGQALNLPLETNPKLAADPAVAAKLAVWFWKSRVSNIVTDFTDTIGVTARINPNMMGLDDRDNNFQLYLRKLKIN